MPIAKVRLAGLVALAIMLVAPAAFADESEAERLFREGRARMLEGRFDEACPMLEESQKLEPHVGTLLNVAACHERQGKVGSAWVEYQKALTAARAEGQSDRAQLAEARIAVLEPRVPWLRISTSASDVSITLDGGELARVAWGQEMPIDPGPHVVVAERRGEKVFEARVELREAERRSVLVSVVDVEESRPAPRLIVEAKPEPEPAKRRGRWIFEPGIFVGFLGGSAARPRLEDAQSISVTENVAGRQPESCGRCTIGETRGSSGVAAGINLFGGYALGEQFDLGVRVVAAPTIGSGSVWGFGPSVVLHPTESLSLGLWGFFGDASFRGVSSVSVPPGYTASSSEGRAEGTLAGGFGAGVEVSVRLFELGGGRVVGNVMPFFLGGNGNAFCLPIGVAYRFQ
ncbi:MAG: tetratricopeptide repeat protein [Labilithrix sp.]|nr:tetratricopeptide repeat protein [Labilithrix sp.]